MTTIEIETPAGRIDGLLSLPTGEGPWPGVVVIHDGFGYGPDKQAISTASHGQAIWRSLRTCIPRRARPMHYPSHARAADQARPRA